MRSWRVTPGTRQWAAARSRGPFPAGAPALLLFRATEENRLPLLRTLRAVRPPPPDSCPNPASSACRASLRCSRRVSSESTRCILWGPPPSCRLHGRSWLSSIQARWRGSPYPRCPTWSRGSEGAPEQPDLGSMEVWRPLRTTPIWCFNIMYLFV